MENVATQVRISGGLVVVMEIEKWPEGRCVLKGELTEFADRYKTRGKREDGSWVLA